MAALRAFALALVAALAVGFAAVPVPAHALAGMISGTVSGSGAGFLGGLTVTFDDTINTPTTTTTSGGGEFSQALPPGDYEVFVDGGSGYEDYFDVVTLDADPASGELGIITLDPARKISGIVLDAATGLPMPDVAVTAISLGTTTPYFPARGSTDRFGAYSIAVPLVPDEYVILAIDANGDYYPQFYDHRLSPVPSGCGCGYEDSIVVDGPGPIFDGIDFDLYSFDDSIYFSIYAETYAGTDYAGVTVFLDKLVGGVWTPQTQGVTDVDGLVDLFGIGDGDYRLRYAKGGTVLKVTHAEDTACGCGGPIVYPLLSSGRVVLMAGLETYATTGTVPTTLEPDLTFAKITTPVVVPGPPSKPRNSPLPTSPTVVSPTPSATPTPTPTPTSDPSPSPTATVEPTQELSPTPDPEPVVDAGFPWWIILVIVLVLGIVITVIVLVRRRP